MNDNAEMRKQFESCVKKGKHIINPIVTWEDEDVWEFIHKYELPYCSEYDIPGVDRLGCIGCPLSSNMAKEMEENPKYRDNYKRAIKRMIERRAEKGKDFWITPDDETVEEIYNWWVYGIVKAKQLEGQLEMEIDEIGEDLE